MDKMRASIFFRNLTWLTTVLLALAFVFLHVGHNVSLRASDELIHAENLVSEAAHSFAIRAECNESAVDAMTASGFSGSITASLLVTDTSQTTAPIGTQVGESVPISTQTSLSTIYSVRGSFDSTITSFTTDTVTVTIYPVPEYSAAGEESCHTVVTETVLVTVYPDATVTAGASTITNVNSQVSYTSSLPDVTLSGSPSTLTAVHTDVSYTSGAPDATVSGIASTVTYLHTEVSVTTGLPDATISGNASTVTNVQVSWSWSLTTTDSTPLTTVTITDLWAHSSEDGGQSTVTTTQTVTSSTTSFAGGISSEVAGDATSLPASPTSTYTQVVTATGGPPVIHTTTVDVFPPPAYTDPSSNMTTETTISPETSSLGASTSVVTPIVISDGNKRPEPKAWGGSNGSSSISCTVMLIAAIMFMI